MTGGPLGLWVSPLSDDVSLPVFVIPVAGDASPELADAASVTVTVACAVGSVVLRGAVLDDVGALADEDPPQAVKVQAVTAMAQTANRFICSPEDLAC